MACCTETLLASYTVMHLKASAYDKIALLTFADSFRVWLYLAGENGLAFQKQCV